MANYLTIFFNTQYGLSPIMAADLYNDYVVIAGSFFRPVGGWLADKMGGIRMLMTLYGVVGIMLAIVSSPSKLHDNKFMSLHRYDGYGDGKWISIPTRSSTFSNRDW